MLDEEAGAAIAFRALAAIAAFRPQVDRTAATPQGPAVSSQSSAPSKQSGPAPSGRAWRRRRRPHSSSTTLWRRLAGMPSCSWPRQQGTCRCTYRQKTIYARPHGVCGRLSSKFVVCDALRLKETFVKSFTQRSPIDKAFDTRAVLDGFYHAQFVRLWR